MQKPPIVLDRSIVAESKIFQIESVQLKFSNGNERYFERLISKRGGAVVIVPFLDEATLLLVNEYCAGTERYELSFPKGLVDPGEDYIGAANRELMEELGYGAKNLRIIKHMTAAPGYWGNTAAIVLARDLYPQKLLGDEPEPIIGVPWKIADFQSLLKREDFTEARSIAALLLVKEMCL